jgi:hypothetical protein
MNTDFLFYSFATDRHSLSAVTCFTKEEEQALADYTKRWSAWSLIP